LLRFPAACHSGCTGKAYCHDEGHQLQRESDWQYRSFEMVHSRLGQFHTQILSSPQELLSSTRLPHPALSQQSRLFCSNQPKILGILCFPKFMPENIESRLESRFLIFSLPTLAAAINGAGKDQRAILLSASHWKPGKPRMASDRREPYIHII